MSSRRGAMAAILGAGGWWRLRASGNPVRMAISETLISDVNVNDARAAMQMWLKRIAHELNITIDLKLFATSGEIQDRIRKGELDAVVMNVLEYRPVAEFMDSNLIGSSDGVGGIEQYLILVKGSSGIQDIGGLRGRRLSMMKGPKMCVGPAWLVNTLAQGNHGLPEQFFASILSESKISRVVLPVFFGQAEACLTTRYGFNTMCELNPQVGRELTVIARSPEMVVNFYIFRKQFDTAIRDRVFGMMSTFRSTTEGQQMGNLFQFDQLTIRNGSSLAAALAELEKADRYQSRVRNRMD